VPGLDVTEVAVGAVGDVWAVFGTAWFGNPELLGAVSTDAGETWSSVRIEGSVRVEDVAISDAGVFVAGVKDLLAPGSRESGGTAAIWRVNGDSVEEIELEADQSSAVRSLVVDGEDLVAFGVDNGRAARWVVGRPGVENVDAPADVGFSDVELGPAGWVAIASTVGSNQFLGRDLLWTSDDGSDWNFVVVGGNRIADFSQEADGSLRVLLEGGDVVDIDPAGGIVGRDTAPLGMVNARSISAAGGVTVITGSTVTDAGWLFVAGTSAPPFHAFPPRRAGGWFPEFVVEASTNRDPFPTAASDGEATFVLADDVVYRVVSGATGLDVQPGVPNVSLVAALDGVVWAARSGPATSEVLVYGSNGIWETERIGLIHVNGVRLEGTTTVYTGWGQSGLAVVRSDGDVEEYDEVPTNSNVASLLPVKDGFLGWPRGGGTPRFSSDLDEWTDVEGWVWTIPQFLGEPFLQPEGAPDQIAFMADWPNLEPIAVPVADPLGVWRWRDRIVVMSSGTLHVSDDGENWEVFPLDVERGAGPTFAVVPGPELAVAVNRGDIIEFSVWR
jgi:hypothetical protein